MPLAPHAKTRLTLHLVLDDACRRVVEVPGPLNLAGLHRVIQAAFRWLDHQPHHFATPSGQTFGPASDGAPGWLDEAEVPAYAVLGLEGAAVAYAYGPWVLTVYTAEVAPAEQPLRPAFIGGEGAGPSEESAWDWAEDIDDWAAGVARTAQRTVGFVPAKSERHFTAMFVPEIFPRLPAEVREMMQRTLEPVRFHYAAVGIDADAGSPSDEDVAMMIEPFQVMLRAIGEGITLTSAGYLPPAKVTEIYRDLGLEARPQSTPRKENHTGDVRLLRKAVTVLGLARVVKGTLLLTKTGRALADEPRLLWDYAVARLPLLEKDRTRREAAWLALVAAAGDPGHVHWSGEQFTALGWRSRDGGLPDLGDMYWLAEATLAVLDSLAPHEPGPLAERGRSRRLMATAVLLRNEDAEGRAGFRGP